MAARTIAIPPTARATSQSGARSKRPTATARRRWSGSASPVREASGPADRGTASTSVLTGGTVRGSAGRRAPRRPVDEEAAREEERRRYRQRSGDQRRDPLVHPQPLDEDDDPHGRD